MSQVAKFLEQKKSIESNNQAVTVVEYPSDSDAPELAISNFPQQFKESLSEFETAWGEFYDKEKVVPIVASLIVQATYQAAINPPTSIWKEGIDLDTRCFKSLWSRGLHNTEPINMANLKSSCPAYAY